MVASPSSASAPSLVLCMCSTLNGLEIVEEVQAMLCYPAFLRALCRLLCRALDMVWDASQGAGEETQGIVFKVRCDVVCACVCCRAMRVVVRACGTNDFGTEHSTC